MGKDGKPSIQEGHSTQPTEPKDHSEKEDKPSLGEKIKGALHKS
jgi:hypothetical protein